MTTSSPSSCGHPTTPARPARRVPSLDTINVPPPARQVLLATSVAPCEVLRGIVRYAREHHWHLIPDMLVTGAIRPDWHGDGVLALLPYDASRLAGIAATGCPCVSLGGTEQSPGVLRVEPDYEEIGRAAADHLLERAHRHFAWAPFVADAANTAQFAGFRDRLAEHGCSCRVLPPAYVSRQGHWQDNWADYRASLLDELQRLPRPAAIFAFNDAVASSLIEACSALALNIPADVAVLGVGDSVACALSAVPLSSVDPDLEEIGYRAAATLGQLLDGAITPARLVRVPPKGVVTRVSTDVIAVKDARVAKALSYLAEHYPDPMLNIAGIASAVGMSRRNLERLFRDETGYTINDHLVGIRMREASRLLKAHPHTKTSEVAALVGLAGERTFFRTFRRHFGMSPRTHRDWAARTWQSPQDAAPLLLPLLPPSSAVSPLSSVRTTAA